MPQFVCSTIVAPVIKIRQERLLPMRGEVVVRVGQEVSPGQVVARSLGEPEYVVLPASDLLKITHEELDKRMEVQIGERVETGTVLVRKRGLFGRNHLVSSVEGTMFDVKNGRIILQRDGEWMELRALMQGRVVNQIQGRGVILESHGSLIQGVWGSGKEGIGPLKVVTKTADSALSAAQLTDEMARQVIVAGKINQADVLEKAAELDIQGIITGSMPADLCDSVQKNSFPVILTDGVGNYRMAQPIFQLLQQMAGRETTLFARSAEQSPNRPEIVIPGNAIPTSELHSGQKPLTVGQVVRVLRLPHHGLVGEVVRLYTYRQMTPSGIYLHGADIKLPDGSVTFIPYNNLDVMNR